MMVRPSQLKWYLFTLSSCPLYCFGSSRKCVIAESATSTWILIKMFIFIWVLRLLPTCPTPCRSCSCLFQNFKPCITTGLAELAFAFEYPCTHFTSCEIPWHASGCTWKLSVLDFWILFAWIGMRTQTNCYLSIIEAKHQCNCDDRRTMRIFWKGKEIGLKDTIVSFVFQCFCGDSRPNILAGPSYTQWLLLRKSKLVSCFKCHLHATHEVECSSNILSAIHGKRKYVLEALISSLFWASRPFGRPFWNFIVSGMCTLQKTKDVSTKKGLNHLSRPQHCQPLSHFTLWYPNASHKH